MYHRAHTITQKCQSNQFLLASNILPHQCVWTEKILLKEKDVDPKSSTVNFYIWFVYLMTNWKYYEELTTFLRDFFLQSQDGYCPYVHPIYNRVWITTFWKLFSRSIFKCDAIKTEWHSYFRFFINLWISKHFSVLVFHEYDGTVARKSIYFSIFIFLHCRLHTHKQKTQ